MNQFQTVVKEVTTRMLKRRVWSWKLSKTAGDRHAAATVIADSIMQDFLAMRGLKKFTSRIISKKYYDSKKAKIGDTVLRFTREITAEGDIVSTNEDDPSNPNSLTVWIYRLSPKAVDGKWPDYSVAMPTYETGHNVIYMPLFVRDEKDDRGWLQEINDRFRALRHEIVHWLQELEVGTRKMYGSRELIPDYDTDEGHAMDPFEMEGHVSDLIDMSMDMYGFKDLLKKSKLGRSLVRNYGRPAILKIAQQMFDNQGRG